MAIIISWVDEEMTIIRLAFQGQWSNEEFRSSGLQAVLMVRSVSHLVYVINDFSASEVLPLGILWQGRNLGQMRPPNWGGAAVITSDAVLINLVEVFMGVYMALSHRQSLFFAKTYEEALEIIARLKRENRVS
jgi:hypothetical protein